MARKWKIELSEMEEKLKEARTEGSTRLFAIAYDPETPVQWHHRKDDAGMQAFLGSRDESESILFNCAIAVVVVNPQDSDETIHAIIAENRRRQGGGMGYFSESF